MSSSTADHGRPQQDWRADGETPKRANICGVVHVAAVASGSFRATPGDDRGQPVAQPGSRPGGVGGYSPRRAVPVGVGGRVLYRSGTFANVRRVVGVGADTVARDGRNFRCSPTPQHTGRNPGYPVWPVEAGVAGCGKRRKRNATIAQSSCRRWPFHAELTVPVSLARRRQCWHRDGADAVVVAAWAGESVRFKDIKFFSHRRGVRSTATDRPIRRGARSTAKNANFNEKCPPSI